MLKESIVKEKNKERNANLDIARTFAIISVIFCHCVELIVSMDQTTWNILNIQGKISRTVLFTVGRLGVPFFLLISGYLILNKKFDTDNDIKLFYKKNLLSLVIATELWIIIYNIFISLYISQKFDVYSLIREMLFLEQVPLMNMWYMPMIIGVYIAIPFLSKIVNVFSIKSLKISGLAVFIVCFIYPTLNALLSILNLNRFGNVLFMNFLGDCYGMYILLGFFISKGFLKCIKNSELVIVSIISFILACIIQMLAYKNFVGFNIWYDSPFILFCGLALFELIMRIKADNINKKILHAFEYISKISLSIYFLHIIVEMLLSKSIKGLYCINPIKILLLFIVSFIITISIIFSFSKIELIKNKLFLIKD